MVDFAKALLRERLLNAYKAGWQNAVRLYAVWRDGEQRVGVMERPLQVVLEKGPPKSEMEFWVRDVLDRIEKIHKENHD